VTQPDLINVNEMSIVPLTYSLNYPFYVDSTVYIAPAMQLRELIISPREAVLRAADNAIHVSIEVSVFIRSLLGFVRQLTTALINASSITAL